MPYVLRIISKSRWYEDPGDFPWLVQGDVQADALSDLRTKGNILSVWRIDDAKSNLEDVIAALAAMRDELDKLDYALIDVETVEKIGINLKSTPGDSLDPEVNKWHIDMVTLSGTNLLSLAHAIHEPRVEKARVLAKEIKSLLLARISAGTLDPSGMKAPVRRKLGLLP